MRFSCGDHLLARFGNMPQGDGFKVALTQDAYLGAVEQIIHNPRLPPRLLKYVIESFGSYLLSGFFCPLRKQYGDVIFIEIRNKTESVFMLSGEPGFGATPFFDAAM